MPKLIFLGSGSIIPTRSRFSSGILLETSEGLRILLDVGPGIIEKLKRIEVDLRTIQAILITHLHLDHVSDLLPLLKIRALIGGGRLRTLGPRGIGEWLDLMLTDERLFGYLSRLGCRKLIDLHELWDDRMELEPGVRISSKPVEHFNGIAYRIDLGSFSITYSGDAVPDPRLIELAKGSDVLIHECSFPAEKLKGKHTSAEDLLKLAAEIDPRILIVTHLYPEMEEDLPRLYQLLQGSFKGKFYVPKDLDVIEV